jgi:hypothetical protein
LSGVRSRGLCLQQQVQLGQSGGGGTDESGAYGGVVSMYDVQQTVNKPARGRAAG